MRQLSRKVVLVVAAIGMAMALCPFVTEGAAPWFLLFHGNALAKRVVMSNWEENQKLMLSIRDEATVKEGSLRGRPFIEMAYFWGSDWAHYVADGKSPQALRPEKGNQHGRFYPAYGDAEPLVTFDSASGPLNRQITQAGLNVLAKYGIPTRLEIGNRVGC